MIDSPVRTPHVSTDHLPSPDVFRALVTEAYETFQSNTEGQNSQVYPALARVPSDRSGICVVGTTGNIYEIGDSQYEFAIMLASPPRANQNPCDSSADNDSLTLTGGWHRWSFPRECRQSV
jgi:glutaminase